MISKVTLITPSNVRLVLHFLQVFDQKFLCCLYLCHACYTATHITGKSHSKTDRQLPPQNVAVSSSL